VRYAQNIMAGPSNAMQAVMMSLLAPFALGDDEVASHRIQLQVRIGRHLQRRRRLLMAAAFDRYRELFDTDQPLLPDPQNFDWEGSAAYPSRASAETQIWNVTDLFSTPVRRVWRSFRKRPASTSGCRLG
jgi:hypothetical protein